VWIELDPSHVECGDCGLGATVAVLTARAEPGAHAAPLPAVDDRWRRAVAAATFTPYGLDGRWTGLRWVGGHGSSNGRVIHLELAHGDSGMRGPQLRVDTRIPQIGGLPEEVVNAALHLVMGFAHEVGGIRDDVRRALFPQDELGVDPLGPWASVAVDVDGTPQPFHLLAEGDHWIAVGRLTTVVLALRARAWDPGDVRLEPIRDLTPYET
jgi:hypothetical protein